MKIQIGCNFFYQLLTFTHIYKACSKFLGIIYSEVPIWIQQQKEDEKHFIH